MKKDLRERICGIIDVMCQGAYEREEVISLSLLAALSGESIFLLGLPGVGKSMVARRLKEAFRGSRSFEYLMSRFSTPDEIFGPVSIGKLKDEDTYERVIDGYLPTADIVFLDEIWKAGPAIQNSLLTALNEKIFRNGDKDITLPLKGVIAASNELPAEGEGLEALWDRFIIRYIVGPITDKGNFFRLLDGGSGHVQMPEELQITDSEYHIISSQAAGIIVPEEIKELLYNLRSSLEKALHDEQKSEEEQENGPGVPYVSDRRWKKALGLMKTSALLNGRDRVDLSDCLLLEHLIWDNENQIDTIKDLLSNCIVDTLNGRSSRFIQDVCSNRSEYLDTDADGNYIAEDGDQEYYISPSDYRSLTARGTGAHFGYGIGKENLIVLGHPTSFKVSVNRKDHICINNVIYPLRKKQDLGSLIKSIQTAGRQQDEKRHISVADIIGDNIFLRAEDAYPELKKKLNRYVHFKK